MDRRGMYCIIRTKNAGVHCGIVDDVRIEGGICCVDMSQVNRLWQWVKPVGGKTLSLYGVAIHGCGKESRIDGTMKSSTIMEVIEIIPCTNEARETLTKPRNNS